MRPSIQQSGVEGVSVVAAFMARAGTRKGHQACRPGSSAASHRSRKLLRNRLHSTNLFRPPRGWTVVMAESRPVYVTLADEIAAGIRGGTYRSGERLPSVRALARARAVSVASALAAYRYLEER
ncbi:GntR family transcriptional regulator, partial [Algiphilus sp.]|uniref:GntR family transcriptional regulator n=1 Tax=Algiphilus sp. TaxID=1872431 RepID=UPI003C5FFF43